MLRSKVSDDGTFDDNSYNSPDSVNSIKWDSLSGASQRKVYNYYKGLIEFRKAHPAIWKRHHHITNLTKMLKTES